MASLTLTKQFAFAACRYANTASPMTMASRHLSTQGIVAVEKLRTALEEYRKEHYRMTLPSRFRKDLLRAAKQDEDGRIAINDMQKVIANISMEHRITEQEMETIFEEMGESGKIAADRLIQLMKTDE